MMEALPVNDEALDWQADRYQAVYVSRNRWLVTALGGLDPCGFQAAALVILLPLKTSVPFLIKEETSGAVVTLRPLAGNPSVTYSESLRKYFLAHYLIDRETYDPMDLARQFSCRRSDVRQETKAGLFRQWADPATRPVRFASTALRHAGPFASNPSLFSPPTPRKFDLRRPRSMRRRRPKPAIGSPLWRFVLDWRPLKTQSVSSTPLVFQSRIIGSIRRSYRE